ncbi:tail fiber assembly protein [Pseudomonas gingeri]
MKYYIDRVSNEVFAYELDGSQDAYIRPNLELLSEEELIAVRLAQAAAAAPTPEQILQAANARRDELLTVASLRIAPLQYAIDLGDATDAENADMKRWKQYCVAVNRVSEQSGFPEDIDWPAPPV